MPADNKTADKEAVDVVAEAAAAKAGASQAQAKHATLRYLTLRIAIFIVALAVLWGVVAATGHVVTTNGALYLMMGAVLVSGVVSFFMLSRQRDAMSTQVTKRAERMTGKFQANAAMEDED